MQAFDSKQPDVAVKRNPRRTQNLILDGAALLIIIGLVIVMTLPNYIDHGRSPTVACQGALKSIEGAKGTWTLEFHKAASDMPSDADLFGPTKYLERKPVCPSGGIYTLGAVDQKPGCSIPSHTI